MNYGFTTLRDLGSVDPEWPTIDLRNALNTGSPAVAVLFNSCRRFAVQGVDGPAGTGSLTTQRWSGRDSNLWFLFEIGSARVGSNDREFAAGLIALPSSLLGRQPSDPGVSSTVG
jgi:hypothetical protein